MYDYKINSRMNLAITGMNRLIAKKYIQLELEKNTHKKLEIEDEIEKYKIFKNKISNRNIKIIENYEKNYAPLLKNNSQ